MHRTLLLIAAAIAFLSAATATLFVARDAQSAAQDFSVVAEFPHDSGAFTQGFDFQNKRLYEGTGQYGESELRRVDLETGAVQRERALGDEYFGEGITVFGKRIYQLTWREHVAFVYEQGTWDLIRRFKYRGEGWGLTHNKRHLIMSNGSDRIYFRDPHSFRIKRRVPVTDDGEPVTNLNELEWVKGRILANVWQTDDVVRIDPETGKVTRRYDLSPLREREEQSGDPDVTNGIAYMPAEGRLFVTGKYWSHVYEVVLED